MDRGKIILICRMDGGTGGTGGTQADQGRLASGQLKLMYHFLSQIQYYTPLVLDFLLWPFPCNKEKERKFTGYN